MYKVAVDFAHQEMRPKMAEWDEHVRLISVKKKEYSFLFKVYLKEFH